MDEATLPTLIESGEGQRVEFKTGLAEHSKEADSLAAFANAQGGVVLFGIGPDGTIRGVPLGNNSLENLANQLRDALDPPNNETIEVLSLDGKQLVAVESESLAWVTYSHGRAYRRVGRTNQHMTSEEQRRRHGETSDMSNVDLQRQADRALAYLEHKALRTRGGDSGLELLQAKAASISSGCWKHVLGEDVYAVLDAAGLVSSTPIVSPSVFGGPGVDFHERVSWTELGRYVVQRLRL